MKKAAEGVVPSNTKNYTKWAVGTFVTLFEERSKLGLSDQLDSKILSSKDTQELSRVLRFFVIEAQKTNGQPFPPETIWNILSAINREIAKNGADFSIMD